jgi:hypothetical protein
MSESALPAITEFLQGVLEDADDLKDVSIVWGPPLGDDRPAELVCVGFGEDGQSGESSRDWATLGGGKLDEEFEVEVTTDVQGHHGTDLKAAYDRSFELNNAVEGAIRADISLGGLLLEPARISRAKGSYYRADKTRGHRVFLTLTGTARI